MILANLFFCRESFREIGGQRVLAKATSMGTSTVPQGLPVGSAVGRIACHASEGVVFNRALRSQAARICEATSVMQAGRTCFKVISDGPRRKVVYVTAHVAPVCLASLQGQGTPCTREIPTGRPSPVAILGAVMTIVYG